MPDKPTIFGEGAVVGFFLGGPLGLALSNAGSSLPALYTKQLQTHGVDVAGLVVSDLSEGLRSQGFQVVPQGQPADAVLHPLVIQYGLTGDLFSSPPVRVPQLWLRIDLKKPGTDERIWWNQGAIHIMPNALKELQPRRIDEFLQDGAFMRSEVQKASKLAIREALSKL